MWIVDKIKGFLSQKGGGDMSTADTAMAQHISQWWDIFSGKQKNSECKYPLPIAVLSTAYLSNLICGELKFELQDEFLNNQVQAHLMPQLDKIVQATLVGGYTVIKPYITRTRQIYFDYAQSLHFNVISFDEVGRVVEGIFTDYAKVGKTEYERQEHHKWQDGIHRVKSIAYIKGSKREVPLASIPRWANLQSEGAFESEIPMITTLRTPYANNIDLNSDLPISIYANSINTLERIDYAHTAYINEMYNMESKVFARSDLFIKDEKEKMRIIDNFFYKVESYDDINKEMFAYAPLPREAHYKNALNTQLRLYEVQTGISSGTFTFDTEKGLVTATQVLSEDRTTYNTVKQLQKQLKPVLEALAEITYTLAKFYGLDVANGEPSAEFGDSVFEDTGTEFSRRLQMVQAGLYKAELFTSWYFGVPEEKAKDMMGDMSQLFGGDG